MRNAPATLTAPTTSSAGPVAPLGRALLLVGDFWTVQILQAVFLGRRRFQDIRDALDISDPVLSRRLTALVGEGVLTTRPYQDHPMRVDYLLTDAGKDLWQVLVSLWAWDVQWLSAPPGPRGAELRHLPCGNSIRPVMGCACCGAIGVGARDVTASADSQVLLADLTQRRGRRSSVASDVLSSTSILGDRWSILVLAHALMGAHHFGEFREGLGISPVTLNARLTLLVDRGVMSRESVTEGAKRQVYRLTPMGLDFFKVTSMINSWAQTWLSEDGRSGLSLRHRACGQELRPQLTCNSCNGALRRHEVRFERDGRPLAAVS